MTEEEKNKLLIEIAKLLELINRDIISYQIKRILPTDLTKKRMSRINVFLSELSSAEDGEVLEDFSNLFYEIQRTIDFLKRELEKREVKNLIFYESGFPKDEKDQTDEILLEPK